MDKHILSYETFLYQKLSSYSNEHLFYIWNQFCLEEQDGEGMIYYNDENFLDMFDKKTIAKKCSDVGYDVNEKFVTVIPVFGGWVSSDSVKDLMNGVDGLIKFYIKNKIHMKEYTTYFQQFKNDPNFIMKEID